MQQCQRMYDDRQTARGLYMDQVCKKYTSLAAQRTRTHGLQVCFPLYGLCDGEKERKEASMPPASLAPQHPERRTRECRPKAAQIRAVQEE